MNPQITIKRPRWKIKYIRLDSPHARPRRSITELLSPWLIVGGFVLTLLLLCALVGE